VRSAVFPRFFSLPPLACRHVCPPYDCTLPFTALYPSSACTGRILSLLSQQPPNPSTHTCHLATLPPRLVYLFWSASTVCIRCTPASLTPCRTPFAPHASFLATRLLGSNAPPWPRGPSTLIRQLDGLVPASPRAPVRLCNNACPAWSPAKVGVCGPVTLHGIWVSESDRQARSVQQQQQARPQRWQALEQQQQQPGGQSESSSRSTTPPSSSSCTRARLPP